ncbi:uncharacterized protein I303_105482 [Kwoniella dejecticola CBS 10117]|uniref:Uncharacterized protein n=1 Tax=Kwoniella dejecticola CBS 10117 TaxID=1296121 RepID=A0AAJ8MID1_9TREE
MSSSRPLLASSYSGIPKRGEALDAVRRDLTSVNNALPTQIHPTERGLFLEAILDDLSDKDNAPWTIWPQDVYILALTAVKSLGRNPVGSESLLSTEFFPVLLHHSGLPFASSFSPDRPPPVPYSAPAREALKILANVLVLHEQGRSLFASSGGAKAVARALAGKDAKEERVVYDKEEDHLERLFLLGRLGFLVTIERPRAVGVMVDTEGTVESLVHHLTCLQPIPPNHMALSELLKLTNNTIRFYPYSQPSTDKTSQSGEEQWDEIFDPLLYPILCQLYNIPFIDISPPLSHALHSLLSIPFLPRLLPTWYSVPIPSSPRVASPTSSVKNLLNRLSNMSTHPNSHHKKSSTSMSSGDGLIPPNHRKTPSPSSSRRSSGSSSTGKPAIPPPHTQDPSAFPTRLIRIFDNFFDTYIPWPKKPDDGLPQGLVLDEMLPPLLLLLTRAVAGSEPIRLHLKETLLPANLDRSPEAGPLEARKGTLGNILRLMGCAGHPQSKTTAGELMWAICKNDAADLCVEIGYGNAAGLLFQKGLAGPLEAKIEEIPADRPNLLPTSSLRHSETSINIQPATPTVPTHSTKQGAGPNRSLEQDRNPITALSASASASTSDSVDLDEMTEEEKEREAERLFVLFDRLEKNPVISMKSNDDSEGRGEEGKVNMMDLMRDKLNSGQFASEDEHDEEKERSRLLEEGKKDEEEALREIEEYKRRIGKK